MNDKTILRGYDIDGTLCESPPKRNKPYFKQTGDERRLHDQKIREHIRNAKVIRQPIPPYIVVTGRKEMYREDTIAWFKENFDVQPISIHMLQKGRTRDNMIELKHRVCKEHNISIYYEDDQKIAVALADSGINVVKV